MTMQSIAVFAALAAVLLAAPLRAHHSESMFDFFPFRIQGRVVEFARVNPHVIVTLEESTADGESRRWRIEGRSIVQLDRRGIGPDYLQAGDEIGFCGFPMKEPFSTPPPGEPPFVHGLVVVLPDGQMQMWGSYGMLRNCVRPDDDPGAWADFLNSNAAARTAWCRIFSVDFPPPEGTTALLTEIDSLMTATCA